MLQGGYETTLNDTSLNKRFDPRSAGLFIWSFLLVGIACVPPAARLPLWMDELFSLTTAEESIPRMLRFLRIYKPFYFDHPPLYFMALHSVLYLGNSPLVLRLISLVSVFLAASVWSLIILRKGFHILVAALAALLIILHPTICYQATNVRMYALFLLITTCSLYVVMMMSEVNDTKKRILLK